MTPSIGDTVVVPVHPQIRPDETAPEPAMVAPAMVTRVINETMVNVTVFPDLGTPYARAGCKFCRDIDSAADAGDLCWWQWPAAELVD